LTSKSSRRRVCRLLGESITSLTKGMDYAG
jgi:hypothetical protein